MSARRPTGHGISVARSERLVEALRRLVKRLRPQAVVETGTYLGLGTTRLILEATADAPPEVFYTIEASPVHYAEAVANLLHAPHVHCLWGLSVDRSAAEAFIREDALLRDSAARGDLYIDSDAPVDAYVAEVGGAGGSGQAAQILPEAWLETLLPRVREQRPLIALDSAGGIGWLEYREVRRLMGSAVFGLFLDDINHVKHHRSFVHLRSDSACEMIDHDEPAGWAVALLSAAGRSWS
ncbi:MAG: hypothetical protein IPM64_05070 [Phycisphaerales bacterium]|nr:hypothetical protein [Phycisphaerales bacterium]